VVFLPAQLFLQHLCDGLVIKVVYGGRWNSKLEKGRLHAMLDCISVFSSGTYDHALPFACSKSTAHLTKHLPGCLWPLFCKSPFDYALAVLTSAFFNSTLLPSAKNSTRSVYHTQHPLPLALYPIWL
jgi:hypothetical protein